MICPSVIFLIRQKDDLSGCHFMNIWIYCTNRPNGGSAPIRGILYPSLSLSLLPIPTPLSLSDTSIDFSPHSFTLSHTFSLSLSLTFSHARTRSCSKSSSSGCCVAVFWNTKSSSPSKFPPSSASQPFRFSHVVKILKPKLEKGSTLGSTTTTTTTTTTAATTMTATAAMTTTTKMTRTTMMTTTRRQWRWLRS